MTRPAAKTLAALAACCSFAAGGAALAGAASNDSSSSKSGSSGSSSSAPDRPHPPREKALTGDTAAKVKAAAEAKVPGGTVLRTEEDAQGGAAYEAHVRKSDGTDVVVLVDKDFKVVAVRDHPRGVGGPGRPGGDRDGHGPGHGPGGRDCPGMKGGSASGSSSGSSSGTSGVPAQDAPAV